jgi:inosose dehydratase
MTPFWKARGFHVSDLLERIAGAPITWGVDESPGWGFLMPRDRVLTEMRDCGLSATELGPDGYLPTDPVELREYLARFQMAMVGGFVPALLYKPDRIDDELAYVTRAAGQLAAAGSKVLVLGPSSHNDGYDTRYDLTEEEWPIFFANLRRLQAIVDEAGLKTALHPHWSMAIEDGADVDRLLESSTVDLCLDTGHLYLAETDPVDVARAAKGRVVHVHLKDVDPAMADRVRSGQALFRQSVIDGLFVPLGEGGVDIAGTIAALEADGYRGWYVLEQDVSLASEPAVGEGPMADAIKSVEYLRSLAATLTVVAA